MGVARAVAETKTPLLDENFRRKFSDAARKGAVNVYNLFNPQRGLKDSLLTLIHQVAGSVVPIERVLEVGKQKDPAEPLLWCTLKMLIQSCKELNNSPPTREKEVLDNLEEKLGTLKQLAI